MSHKKNTYFAQEMEYKKMEKNGTQTWGAHIKGSAVEDTNHDFIDHCASQSWFPEPGRAMEFGCGTAPMLRYLCEKGFSGTGVEICETAVKLAQEQSKGMDLEFKVADVSKDNLGDNESYDLIIDGNCLHCISINGNPYLPTRYIEHWKNIMKRVEKNGLKIKNFRVNICPDENLPMSHISIAAQKI